VNKPGEAAQGFGIQPLHAGAGPGKPGGFLTPKNWSLNFSNFFAKTAFAYNRDYSHLPLPHPFARHCAHTQPK